MLIFDVKIPSSPPPVSKAMPMPTNNNSKSILNQGREISASKLFLQKDFFRIKAFFSR